MLDDFNFLERFIVFIFLKYGKKNFLKLLYRECIDLYVILIIKIF